MTTPHEDVMNAIGHSENPTDDATAAIEALREGATRRVRNHWNSRDWFGLSEAQAREAVNAVLGEPKASES